MKRLHLQNTETLLNAQSIFFQIHLMCLKRAKDSSPDYVHTNSKYPVMKGTEVINHEARMA